MSRRESRTQSFYKKMRYSLKSLKGYKYVNDYNNTSMKECQRYDEENQYLYEKNVALYNRTSKMLEKRNAIFGLPEPPRKPRSPSNVELFVIFKRRKEKTDNKLQTLAVIYLLKKEYNLIVDPDVSLIGSIKGSFEPYQAIELAEKVARENNENYVKDMLDYVNENKIYLKDEPQDKSVTQKIRFYNNQNIMIRRKSNSSIESRSRSNSDTFVIEQKINEMRERNQHIVKENNFVNPNFNNSNNNGSSNLQNNMYSSHSFSYSNPNLGNTNLGNTNLGDNVVLDAPTNPYGVNSGKRASAPRASAPPGDNNVFMGNSPEKPPAYN
jgi:hypothetical protein